MTSATEPLTAEEPLRVVGPEGLQAAEGAHRGRVGVGAGGQLDALPLDDPLDPDDLVGDRLLAGREAGLGLLRVVRRLAHAAGGRVTRPRLATSCTCSGTPPVSAWISSMSAVVHASPYSSQMSVTASRSSGATTSCCSVPVRRPPSPGSVRNMATTRAATARVELATSATTSSTSVSASWRSSSTSSTGVVAAHSPRRRAMVAPSDSPAERRPAPASGSCRPTEGPDRTRRAPIGDRDHSARSR